MIKTITLMLSLLFIYNITLAQKETAGFKLNGTVVDSATGQGIPEANILLLDRHDNTNLGGAAADKTGKFVVSNIKNNIVRIRFSMIGYQSKVIDSLSLENISNIGIIKLRSTLYEIPEVSIKTIKPMIEIHADKQVINIDQVPAGSGTLTDVLKNSGTVNVDPQTNEITVRGETVKIQMDGHPYDIPASMLSQFPAANAEQIEVILAPSAKESAEGGTYIINIISKKNVLDSYSGSVNLSLSSNKRNTGGLNLNYKTDKINIFGSVSILKGEFGGKNSSEKINKYSPDFYFQKNEGNNLTKFTGGFYKLGIDYIFDEKNSMTITGSYNGYKGDARSLNASSISDASLTRQYGYNNSSLNSFKQEFISFYGFYKRKFDNIGEELTIDALLIRINVPSTSDMDLQYDNGFYPLNQNITASEGSKTFIFKTEYAKPTSIGKFETGYNLTLRDRENNYNTLDFLSETNTWADTSRLSNFFKYKENINALYLTYSNKFENLEVKTGIRMENLNTQGDQVTINETFKENFVNFFPNFNLSYKISDRFQLTFNTFRRVTYPNLASINPFKKYNGPNNYSTGNPRIQPQFASSYSISLSQYINMYYVHFTNNITNATAVINDSISYTSPVNLNSTNLYGVELTLPYYNTPSSPFHLPDFVNMLTIQLGYTRREQAGKYLNEELTYAYESKWINMNLGLKLWYEVNAGFSFRYRPRTSDIKNLVNEIKDLAISINKSFLDQKLKINLSISGLLNPEQFITETWGTTFSSKSSYKPNIAQNITLGVIYMFNDFKERRDRNIDDGRDTGGKEGF